MTNPFKAINTLEDLIKFTVAPYQMKGLSAGDLALDAIAESIHLLTGAPKDEIIRIYTQGKGRTAPVPPVTPEPAPEAEAEEEAPKGRRFTVLPRGTCRGRIGCRNVINDAGKKPLCRDCRELGYKYHLCNRTDLFTCADKSCSNPVGLRLEKCEECFDGKQSVDLDRKAKIDRLIRYSLQERDSGTLTPEEVEEIGNLTHVIKEPKRTRNRGRRSKNQSITHIHNNNY